MLGGSIGALQKAAEVAARPKKPIEESISDVMGAETVDDAINVAMEEVEADAQEGHRMRLRLRLTTIPAL